MAFKKRIAHYEEEMVKTLKELIAIPSVKSEPAGPGAPFGREIARALEYVLAWGEKNGFVAENFSGYAGHLEYGEGKETVGVLLHLDVVPAGEGWQYPPFEGIKINNRVYGRGAVDDKGPVTAVLYALKALKEEGVKPARKIRVIFGCDEESNWECMEHYFQQVEKPACGFAPDGDFPLINCEKGFLGLLLQTTALPAGEGPVVKRLRGGTRLNVVPEEAEALLVADDPQVFSLMQEKAAGDGRISVHKSGTEIMVKVKGKSAHASLPHLGENAVVHLLQFLAALEWKGGRWDLIRLLAEKFAGYNGEGLGIACRDERSGALTLNLGTIDFSGDKGQLEVDIRYPLCTDEKRITGAIEEKLAGTGFTLTKLREVPPHYLPVESPLVRTLLAVYREETGDCRPPLAIGGRTYAVALGNGVAFGPNLPGREKLAHQKDEYISVPDLLLCARIYADAMYRLAAGGCSPQEGKK